MRFARQQILVALERLQHGAPQALAEPGDADPDDGECRRVDEIGLGMCWDSTKNRLTSPTLRIVADETRVQSRQRPLASRIAGTNSRNGESDCRLGSSRARSPKARATNATASP